MNSVELRAYLAWPASAALSKSLPGVTICHATAGECTRPGRCAPLCQARLRRDRARSPFPRRDPDRRVPRPRIPDGGISDADAGADALDFASVDFRAYPAVDENKLGGSRFCFSGVIWRLFTIYPVLTAHGSAVLCLSSNPC